MEDLKNKKNEIDTTLKFIELTKSGEYAVIEEINLDLSRYQDDAILTDPVEDEYYYSIS